jgi:hypothetical protein
MRSVVGLRIRKKTVRIALFRAEVSKSSTGWKIKVGVPCLRLAKDQRGWWLQLGGRHDHFEVPLGRRQAPPAKAWPAPQDSDKIVMEDATGAGATELPPVAEVLGTDGLVARLNQAARRWALWPVALLATVGVVGALMANGRLGTDSTAIAVLAGLAVTVWLALRDLARTSVVVLYELESAEAEWSASLINVRRRLGIASMVRLALRTHGGRRSIVVSLSLEGSQAEWFAALVKAWRPLMEVTALWRIRRSGRLDALQRKANGGREFRDDRVPVGVALKACGVLVTNVEVPSLVDENDGREHQLYFLPDRVLARTGTRFAAMSYATLQADWQAMEFVEDEVVPVPRDSDHIRMTRKYVNLKDGEPDKRHTKDNPSWPVMLYGRIEFTSDAGLKWILVSSQAEVAKRVVDAIRSAEEPRAITSVRAVDGTTGPSTGRFVRLGGRKSG